MAQDAVDHARIWNKGDDAHAGAAGAGQRVDFCVGIVLDQRDPFEWRARMPGDKAVGTQPCSQQRDHHQNQSAPWLAEGREPKSRNQAGNDCEHFEAEVPQSRGMRFEAKLRRFQE
jgi:hypothetical protein